MIDPQSGPSSKWTAKCRLTSQIGGRLKESTVRRLVMCYSWHEDVEKSVQNEGRSPEDSA